MSYQTPDLEKKSYPTNVKGYTLDQCERLAAACAKCDFADRNGLIKYLLKDPVLACKLSQNVIGDANKAQNMTRFIDRQRLLGLGK